MFPFPSHGMVNIHNELTAVHMYLCFDSTYIHVNPGDIFKPVTNYSLPHRPVDDRGVLFLIGGPGPNLSLTPSAGQPVLPFISHVTGRPGQTCCDGRSLLLLTRYILCLRALSGPTTPPRESAKNIYFVRFVQVQLLENWAHYCGCNIVLNGFKVTSTWWIGTLAIVKCQQCMTFWVTRYLNNTQRWVMTSHSAVVWA